MTIETPHRRGFATLLALLTVALIGVTIAGLATRFSTEARRDAAERDQTQLRQLKVAGTIWAGTAVDIQVEVSLPPVLKDAGYMLTLRQASDGASNQLPPAVHIAGRHLTLTIPAPRSPSGH